MSYYRGSVDGKKVAAALGVALALGAGHAVHHHGHHHGHPPAAATPTAAAGGSYRTAERAWVGAGGPRSVANIAAAITVPESGSDPREIQQGQPYPTTGWGSWQITPGNSEPQCGTDSQLLNWRANACAAVAKYRAAGDSFTPWTTYNDGAYRQFVRS